MSSVLIDANVGAQLVPLAQRYLKGQSSLAATVYIAREEFATVLPEGAAQASHMLQGKALLAHYKHCEMLWELLHCSSILCGPDPMIKAAEIKNVKNKLAYYRQASNAMAHASKPQRKQFPKTAQLQLAGKRQDAAETAAMAMSTLTISNADRERYLYPFDSSKGLTPQKGPAECPVVLTAKDLSTLVGTQWLEDTVINAFLSLVCHSGNGHLVLPQNTMSREGSPKWHAWSTHFFEGFTNAAGFTNAELWPPKLYPRAEIEDVQHYFFPLHSTNHWVMFHVYQTDADWYADFYSSIPKAYDFEIDRQWPLIAKELLSFSNGKLRLSRIRVRIPSLQPHQLNSADCGVLALSVARWKMEGWGLGSLKPENCMALRQRMMVELQKWRLD